MFFSGPVDEGGRFIILGRVNCDSANPHLPSIFISDWIGEWLWELELNKSTFVYAKKANYRNVYELNGAMGFENLSDFLAGEMEG